MILPLLLAVVIPLSLILWLTNIFIFTVYSAEGSWEPVSPARCVLALVVPLYMAKSAIFKRSLNYSGAVAAVGVGFILILSNYCFFVSMVTFFILGSRVTKFRSERKMEIEADYKAGGQRNWRQVLCNGGVATQLAVIFMMETGCSEPPIDFTHRYTVSWLSTAVLGALACSAGDTFSSEIGSVVGSGDPVLITSFQTVPRGTNGAISLAGTVSSFIGGAFVGLAYHATLILVARVELLEECPPQWPLILIGGLAGLLGSLIDSLLGATLQYSGYDEKKRCVVATRGPGVIDISGSAVFDNHSVNLLSSLITCLLTPHIALTVWQVYNT